MSPLKDKVLKATMLAPLRHFARFHDTVRGSEDQRASRLTLLMHLKILTSCAKVDSEFLPIQFLKWQVSHWKAVIKLSLFLASTNLEDDTSSSSTSPSSFFGRAMGNSFLSRGV